MAKVLLHQNSDEFCKHGDHVSVGNMATISGTGTVKGITGYSFTATVTNGPPDSLGIVIKKPDGSTYYSAGPKNISGGDLEIQ